MRIDLAALQYGEESGKRLREPGAEAKVGALDQLAIDCFLNLPAARRQLVRALIEALAEGR